MPRPPTPPPIIIPNCVQFSMHHTFTGGRFSYSFHMAQTAAGPLNPAFAESLFSALKGQTGLTSWYTNHCTTDVEFSGVTAKDMRSGNNPTLLSTGLPLAGGVATPGAPIQAALVVTHRTAQSGRSFRGRTYLGGLPVADMADHRTWSGAAGTAAVALLNAIDAAAQANGGGLVIGWIHLLAGTDSNGGALADRPAATIDITGFDIANPRIDTQRKRLGR